MNSLTIQAALAKRCLALAPKVYTRSLSSTRGLFNEAAKEDQTAGEAPKAKSEPVKEDPSSIKGFYERGVLSKPVYDALTRLKFKNFTPVQTQTIEPLTNGDKGIIARAKTGTGKTLAFGLPLIDRALKRDSRHRGAIGLIISPTRDLAYQIRDELLKVTKQFGRDHPSVNVHCLVGAEPKFQQIKAFTRSASSPQIIVATPGRLYDMMENPVVQKSLASLEFKVLDEADRLLDDGFKDDLLQIEEAIRDLKGEAKAEHTLLFSATIDRNVMSFAEKILGKDLNYIDCVDENEPETHEKIEQSLIATDNFYQSLVSSTLFIENEAQNNVAFKSIVFLPTVKAVAYYKQALDEHCYKNQLRLPVFELHGKLSQSQRDRSVKNFRERSRGVLVTSDVGARGMDFPGVTNVVQIGVPTDTTNYVHRIGRTARGGKTGSALLILSKPEAPFVKQLMSRKIKIAKQYAYEKIPDAEEAFTELLKSTRMRTSIDEAIESLCGFYNGAARSYRMQMPNVLASLTSSYASIVGQEGARPTVGRNLWSTVLRLQQREAARYFDIERPRRSFGSDDDDFTPRANRFGEEKRSYGKGFRGGDRGGDRSGERGGFRGGFRNDRGGDRGGFRSQRAPRRDNWNNGSAFD